jgi:hypothetical protein
MTATQQLHLFVKQTGRIVRPTDPITSVIAAEKKVTSGTIETDQEKILAVLGKRPDYDTYRSGWTALEISYEICGSPEKGTMYHKISRRLGELKTAGCIYVVCTRISAIGGMDAQAYRKK